jgi:two-component system, NtrC family, response regulator HupR/HoxA
MAVSEPWWTNLDVPGLRYVRTVLHHHKMDLVLTERGVDHETAHFAVAIETPTGSIGSLCAVPWAKGALALPPDLTVILQLLLTTAAQDVAAALPLRNATSPVTSDSPARRSTRDGYESLIGNSAEMQSLYVMIDRLSTSDTTVLIQGENGTGKELVAHAIHHRSLRATQRFVGTNCSAFNDNLLDTELFGHKRGAFTGAVVDKAGLFESADGGTFFLDEIGDMSPTLQVKVLRVLQEGTFNRVGDTDTRKVDVRIIAATNRDLAAMVAAGTFREDLFYRINVINVVLPPLRERLSDVPMLIDAFLRKHLRVSATKEKQISEDCMSKLLSYEWPGNVRELENEVERLIVLSGESSMIHVEQLSPRIRDANVVPLSAESLKSLPAATERLERKMIAAALQEFAGNKTRAAQVLQVSRRNLIRLVQKYELD